MRNSVTAHAKEALLTLMPLLIAYGCLSLTNLVLMTGLHFFHDRQGYYKTAALIWLGIVLSYIGDGYLVSIGSNLMHIFGLPLMTISMYYFAKLSSSLYRFELPFKKIQIFIVVTWIIGSLSYLIPGVGFEASSFLICLGIALPGAMAGYKIFQSTTKTSLIDKFFGAVLLTQTAHIMDYPFLRLHEGAAVYGFSFAISLIYLLSLLIPIVINQRLSADVNETLESKVQERTKELLQARENLVSSAKMSALGEMTGSIAHEINNPLAVIKLVSSQIEELVSESSAEGADDGHIPKDMIKEMAATIDKTVDRISKIINGLRSFVRDGSKDLPRRVNARNLVIETVGLCVERFRNHKIPLSYDDIPENLEMEVREIEMSQVILNLLNNAHDAIFDSKEKWVQVSARETESSIEIRVTDSGKGIPHEIQAKLFQPFFTTKEAGKGTGIGLSISTGIVRDHQGELAIDSTASNTCFVIRLPKVDAYAIKKVS
jgi:signal transduction histidine kinase